MDRDFESGGSDVGRDELRDLADDSPGILRDAAPDVLAPIDITSPVSGHVPAAESSGRRSRSRPSTTGRRPGRS